MDRLKKLNLLFLEDNEEFAKNTTEFLSIYFEKVLHSNNIQDALKLYADNRIDVIISDIKVNDGNGLDFIKSIREKNKTVPIVVLSAHKDESFLFKAIPLNITSYELKPLSYSKFLALLKKLSDLFIIDTSFFQHQSFSYSFKNKTLMINNKEINLTKKELLFLELIIQNKDSVVSNETIQRDVWDDQLMSDSAIKNLVFRLRKKLGVEFITCITGIGYKLSLNH